MRNSKKLNLTVIERLERNTLNATTKNGYIQIIKKQGTNIFVPEKYKDNKVFVGMVKKLKAEQKGMIKNEETLKKEKVILSMEAKVEKQEKSIMKSFQDNYRGLLGYKNLNFKILDKDEMFFPGNKSQKYLERIKSILILQRQYKNGTLNEQYKKYIKYFLSDKDLISLKEDILKEYNQASEKIKDFPQSQNIYGSNIRMFKLKGNIKEILGEINQLDDKQLKMRTLLFNMLHKNLMKAIIKIVASSRKGYGTYSIFRQFPNNDEFANELISKMQEDIFRLKDFRLTKVEYNGQTEVVVEPDMINDRFPVNLINSIIVTEGFTITGKEIGFPNGPSKGKTVSQRILFEYIRKLITTMESKSKKTYNNEKNFSSMEEGFIEKIGV